MLSLFVVSSSTSFHPQTGGRSEKTNNTVAQILQGKACQTQTDWNSHLAAVEFAINPAVNVSTGRSPVELVLTYQPRVSPIHIAPSNVPVVEDFITERESMVAGARDAMGAAKVAQSAQANAHCGEEPDWKEGDQVMIDSKGRWARYKVHHPRWSGKLYPRWDGPDKILKLSPGSLNCTLNLGLLVQTI